MSRVRKDTVKRSKPRRDYCRKAKKPRHATEKAALTAQNRAGKAGDVDLFHYKCPHCHDYHLTSRPQQEA